MVLISFLINLAGATMLLLFAVRMVRTGIERAFGPSFNRAVTGNRNRVSAAATGLLLAVILQSSAAVALLVSGFAGAGAVTFGTGLAVVLGADLGSALLIQVFSFDLSWLVPVLLAVGGALFVKSERRSFRQAGRIILGIAFILISLRFLRETMDPIRDSAFLPAIAGYLERDYLTAFIVGAALAFAMHSSVAVVLMCVTMVAIQAIPTGAGVSLVLGANLGSALIPMWLTRSLENPTRRIPLANLLVRGTGAVVALVLLNETALLSHIGPAGSAQSLINAHILFNGVLLVLMVNFTGLLETPCKALLPDGPPAVDEASTLYRCTLDDAALERPHQAIANLRREVLRMVQIVETMMAPVMELYLHFDGDTARAVRAKDHFVNVALDEVRRYGAALRGRELSKTEGKAVRELIEYAIAVETAGDIVAKRLIPLAREKSEKAIQFSDEGAAEISNMHKRAAGNILLASNLLVSGDTESARLLLEEKQEMARLERKSRKRHLRRLSEGVQISFDSSDIHLETVGGLRDFNSHISSAAYPILYREGQLLETRLIEQNLEDPDVRQR